jgi:hypothetical protein
MAPDGRPEEGPTMEYALLIYGDEKVWASRDEAETKATNERHARFVAMLTERGAMRGGNPLALTDAATTVRNGDDVSVTDGPFAETAEVLGGYYVIEAADLDEAIALAKQVPEPVVEIRPIGEMPEGM